jgi:hypothetical protein
MNDCDPIRLRAVAISNRAGVQRMSSFRLFPFGKASTIVISTWSPSKALRSRERVAMSASMNAGSDLELFHEDLSASKRNVSNLIEHMKGGAASRAKNAAGEVERRVRNLRQQSGAERDRSAKALKALRSEQTPCCIVDRGPDLLRRRPRSMVGRPATASDLIHIALGVLQPVAAAR